MKRALFATLTLLAIGASAFASGVAVPRTVDVNWRQQIAAVPGGFADSSTARAARSATAHDTTGAIDIREFVLPGKGAGQLPTASDSLAWLRIDIFPVTTTPAVAADSVNMTIQVSNDGVLGWVTCTPTTVFDTATDSGNGAIILEQGTTNAFYYVLRQQVGAVAVGDIFFPIRSSSTAPDFQSIYGWPYMRIILQGDMTGRYDVKVHGFAAN